MKPTYKGDCYIETAKCYFSLPEEEWENCRMRYQLMEMKDVRVLANCLLLDDVKLSHKQVFANLYTIFILE